MELKWSTPRTESKAASLNFEIKNEETLCFRDIVDELEEGETDLEASLKEAYRYSWIYHPTVCNESNPTFSGKHLTWSMLTVPEALTGETIFHFCSSSFEFLFHCFREELVAWLDLCGAEINVSRITGLLFKCNCWIQLKHSNVATESFWMIFRNLLRNREKIRK